MFISPKKICLFLTLAATLPLANLTATRAEEPTAIKSVITTPLEPIAVATNGGKHATRVQTLILPQNAKLEQINLTVSNPALVDRIEARIGSTVIGEEEEVTEKTAVVVDAEVVAKALEGVQNCDLWLIPNYPVDIDQKLCVNVTSCQLNGVDAPCERHELEYRLAALVRESGWDSVARYRIPGIARTNKGTLVAVYDARYNGWPDLPANIDVMCSRSFDNGNTWTPMATVFDFHGQDEALEGVGDPMILVDPTNDRIWVAALWAHNGKSTAASEPNLVFGTSGRLVLTYSDDQGETWAEPRDITNDAAPNSSWRLLFQGPGNGIAMRDGTLVMPAQFIDKDKVWHSTLVVSHDHGETWSVGTGARKMTCESQVVELNNGDIMINMRNFSGHARSVATTSDFGQTWQEDPSSCKALIEPICQASLIRVFSTEDGDDANLLAFMNPNDERSRINMTIQLSEDEGQTWPRALTLYRPGGAGYSCLVKIDVATLGALYENSSGGLIFQRVKLEEIPQR